MGEFALLENTADVIVNFETTHEPISATNRNTISTRLRSRSRRDKVPGHVRLHSSEREIFAVGHCSGFHTRDENAVYIGVDGR